MEMVSIEWASAINVIGFTFLMVFLLLILIVFILSLLGKVVTSMDKTSQAQIEKVPHTTKHSVSDKIAGEELAAISMALYTYFSREHDIESNVVTIQKVSKPYSPWSSKIHGLNIFPKMLIVLFCVCTPMTLIAQSATTNSPDNSAQISHVALTTPASDASHMHMSKDLSGADTVSEPDSIQETFIEFLKSTGFAQLNWGTIIMLLVACVLLYLAIVKKFEPLLLLPIAFGMLLSNIPGGGLYHPELFAGGKVHWDMFRDSAGLFDYLYLGVKLEIYPCLIFVGVGAMTDFGPLIANPKSLFLGAAAQLGVVAAFLLAFGLEFTLPQAASIGIIGGADGPTAIFLTSKLAPELLGPIAVAAYSYMALVPVIQPPIMRLLTTKKERGIRMKQLRTVSKKEKIIFPIFITVLITMMLPAATPLIGCLMLGNLMKESGVVDRLSKTVQNELINIVTIFLGLTVGATATAVSFLNLQTLQIMLMGVIAFGFGSAGGVLLAKFMNLFLKEKMNPLIGSAGVSAVPMAARVSQVVGQEADPSNFLLMHAMGPNVAGVIGSAVAAGLLLTMLG